MPTDFCWENLTAFILNSFLGKFFINICTLPQSGSRSPGVRVAQFDNRCFRSCHFRIQNSLYSNFFQFLELVEYVNSLKGSQFFFNYVESKKIDRRVGFRHKCYRSENLISKLLKLVKKYLTRVPVKVVSELLDAEN